MGIIIESITELIIEIINIIIETIVSMEIIMGIIIDIIIKLVILGIIKKVINYWNQGMPGLALSQPGAPPLLWVASPQDHSNRSSVTTDFMHALRPMLRFDAT